GKAAAGSLASNEPAIAGSDAVRAAVAATLGDLHRYPDPLASELRDRLAAEHGVDADQVLVGNGSDELIFLLVLAYAAMGGSVGLATPPYRMHELVPAMLGARVEAVALRQWRHDLGAMSASEVDLAFVCNPHNPTGTAVSGTEIAAFARDCRAGLVVVDEAYVEFADDPGALSAMPLAAAGELVVMRTFSKLHGLAALRVGYLVGPAGVVGHLRTLRMPFSVNVAAQAAAAAALADRQTSEAVRCYTAGARQRLVRAFASAGYASVPSQANFILVLADDEEGLVRQLARSGVSVRPGRLLGVPGAVRVSVPSPEGMELLEEALRRR
ncbi:MAG: pyridoxal phosphate-dependent aminotransferase, partial [Acidimicrobiales bacterium]